MKKIEYYMNLPYRMEIGFAKAKIDGTTPAKEVFKNLCEEIMLG